MSSGFIIVLRASNIEPCISVFNVEERKGGKEGERKAGRDGELREERI